MGKEAFPDYYSWGTVHNDILEDQLDEIGSPLRAARIMRLGNRTANGWSCRLFDVEVQAAQKRMVVRQSGRLFGRPLRSSFHLRF
jgi:hypothetical protein